MQAWEEKVLEREAGRQEGMEVGRREGIEALILDNLEEGISKERIIEQLVKRFEVSLDKATEYYKEIVI